MGRIPGNDDDALKFPGSAIWRFLTGEERVIGGTPEMPIGAIGKPHFGDFTHPEEAPAAKTHQLIGVIRKIRHASLNSDFNNKLIMALRRRFRETKSEEFFLGRSIFFFSGK